MEITHGRCSITIDYEQGSRPEAERLLARIKALLAEPVDEAPVTCAECSPRMVSGAEHRRCGASGCECFCNRSESIGDDRCAHTIPGAVAGMSFRCERPAGHGDRCKAGHVYWQE